MVRVPVSRLIFLSPVFLSRVLLSLLVLSLLGPAARADALEDNVRAALDARDIAALESLLAEAHAEAVAATDFTSLRAVYNNLFETAHRARFAATETWFQTVPTSPYAATALAWSYHHRSFLLRGQRALSATSDEAYSAYAAERGAARALVGDALDAAEDFIPALDLALLLMTDSRADAEIVKSLAARALDLAPSRRTLRLAQVALSFDWGGSMQDNLDLCVSLADKVPGYDADLCLIEVAFQNKATGAFREAALTALETRDEPFLDYARLDAYLNEWRSRPEAADEAQRIHRAMLANELDIDGFKFALQQMQEIFGLTFYWIEMRTAPLAALRARLVDDPQNYRLALALADELFELRADDPSVDLGEAEALWPDMLALGHYEPDVWRMGMALAVDTPWPAYTAQAPFRANQIYYSNHDAGVLRFYLMDLFQGWMIATGETRTAEAEVDPEALKEMVRCPLFRVSRLYDAVCATDPGAGGCTIGGWGSDFPARARRLMKKETACEWERTAPLDELVFAPVPVEEFLKEKTP